MRTLTAVLTTVALACLAGPTRADEPGRWRKASRPRTSASTPPTSGRSCRPRRKATGEPEGPQGQERRPVLLSQGHDPRLHQGVVRVPRHRQEVRRRDTVSSASAPTSSSAAEVHREGETEHPAAGRPRKKATKASAPSTRAGRASVTPSSSTRRATSARSTDGQSDQAPEEVLHLRQGKPSRSESAGDTDGLGRRGGRRLPPGSVGPDAASGAKAGRPSAAGQLHRAACRCRSLRSVFWNTGVPFPVADVDQPAARRERGSEPAPPVGDGDPLRLAGVGADEQQAAAAVGWRCDGATTWPSTLGPGSETMRSSRTFGVRPGSEPGRPGVAPAAGGRRRLRPPPASAAAWSRSADRGFATRAGLADARAAGPDSRLAGRPGSGSPTPAGGPASRPRVAVPRRRRAGGAGTTARRPAGGRAARGPRSWSCSRWSPARSSTTAGSWSPASCWRPLQVAASPGSTATAAGSWSPAWRPAGSSRCTGS